MSQVTRRQFLQISGVVLAESQWLPSLKIGRALAAHGGIQGRALAPLTVSRADGSAAMLLPDSVVTILGVKDDRYVVSGGFVPRALVQPMTVTQNTFASPTLPFLAEICAPVAAIRASCAADAPLLGRIGHAGTATVLSRLSDGRGGTDWYEIETGGLIGWAQSTLWTPVIDIGNNSAKPRTVTIDRATQTITAFEDGQPALQALVSVAPTANAGNYAISGRQPSGLASDGSGVQYGAPWLLQFDGGDILGGSTWHNRFGQSTPGMLVQASPQVAKWLYGWLADDSTVTIR